MRWAPRSLPKAGLFVAGLAKIDVGLCCEECIDFCPRVSFLVILRYILGFSFGVIWAPAYQPCIIIIIMLQIYRVAFLRSRSGSVAQPFVILGRFLSILISFVAPERFVVIDNS